MTADDSRRDEEAEPAIRRTCDLAHPFKASFDPRVHGPLSTVIRASITSRIVSRARHLLLGDGIFSLRPGVSTSRTVMSLEELKRVPTPFRLASLEAPRATRLLIERRFADEANLLLDRAAQVAEGDVTLLGQRTPLDPP